ncbi:MAG: glycosyltransferase family 2 protein [bacterium]|nr:glycosyltransferase family 2 protein [bacterium]
MAPPETAPRLSVVVVHWRNERQLAELLDAWPDEPRCELLVIDNSSSLGELPPPVRYIDPGGNLGFAGGVNRGVEAARAPWVLLVNPDVRPQGGAVERLLDSLDRFSDAAGVVPALVGADGEPQYRWQLRPLPSPASLLLHTLFLAGVRGPRREPERGAVIEQPAGAALVVRRSVLVEIGGLDAGFYPAWFEDVDLARRLRGAGHRLVYEPASRWVHATGGSVPELGYGPFLWVYYRNLMRYLRIHHGGVWSLLGRCMLPLGMGLRILLLPLRRPRRAAGRAAAAAGLAAVIAGALSGWRRPRSYLQRFSPP